MTTGTALGLEFRALQDQINHAGFVNCSKQDIQRAKTDLDSLKKKIDEFIETYPLAGIGLVKPSKQIPGLIEKCIQIIAAESPEPIDAGLIEKDKFETDVPQIVVQAYEEKLPHNISEPIEEVSSRVRGLSLSQLGEQSKMTYPSRTRRLSDSGQRDRLKLNYSKFELTQRWSQNFAEKRKVASEANELNPALLKQPINSPSEIPTALSPQEIKPKVLSTILPTPITHGVVTSIIVECRVPKGHFLEIYGMVEGESVESGLSWEAGILLQDLGNDRWGYSFTARPGQAMLYKIVADGKIWENCDNRSLKSASCDSEIQIVPSIRFPILPLVVDMADLENRKLYILGNGPGMNNWKTAIELKKMNGVYVLPLPDKFEPFMCKLRLDDNRWEVGNDHQVLPGQELVLSPRF